MKPIFEQLARQFSSQKVIFGKIITDESPELSSVLDIRAIPTFIILKNGEMLARVSGAIGRDRLLQAIKITLDIVI
jgi:thioredoxin 1